MEKIVKVYEELYADMQATGTKDFINKVNYHGLDDEKMSELCKKHDCEWNSFGYIESCTYTVAGNLKTRYCVPVAQLPDTIAAYKKTLKPIKQAWQFEPKKRNLDDRAVGFQWKLNGLVSMESDKFEAVLEAVEIISSIPEKQRSFVIKFSKGAQYWTREALTEATTILMEVFNLLSTDVKNKFFIRNIDHLKQFIAENWLSYEMIDDYAEYIIKQRHKLTTDE